jgi:hypothetical protein
VAVLESVKDGQIFKDLRNLPILFRQRLSRNCEKGTILCMSGVIDLRPCGCGGGIQAQALTTRAPGSLGLLSSAGPVQEIRSRDLEDVLFHKVRYSDAHGLILSCMITCITYLGLIHDSFGCGIMQPRDYKPGDRGFICNHGSNGKRTTVGPSIYSSFFPPLESHFMLESFIHCVTTAGFSSGPSSCVDLLQYLA